MKRITFLYLMLLTGCASANGNDMHIETLTAPDGAQCYVVVQNGNAAGLSCK